METCKTNRPDPGRKGELRKMSEKQLDEAVDRVKRLKEGEKKRLLIKAVTRYIDAMIGES